MTTVHFAPWRSADHSSVAPMTAQPAIRFGRIMLDAAHPPAVRPQLGGRRPPRDSNSRIAHRISTNTRRRRQLCEWLRGSAGALTVAMMLVPSLGLAQATAKLPDLTGTYHCEGNQMACDRAGWTLKVTQSGADLEIKNEKGDFGNGKLESQISLSAGPIWNMLGVVMPDSRSLVWSNGTIWRKES